MKAYWKDIVRTIAKGKKRFFSIMIITILGVTMFTGITAACKDLRQAADNLFDEQNLYDIKIVSTLGLTQDDVEALQTLDGIERAEGTYSETVYTEFDGKTKKAEIKVLKDGGLSQPDLIEGTMPSKQDEIAVTENYCKNSGNTIGDTLVLTVDDEETSGLIQNTFTITAIVLDVTNLIVDEGAASYRSSDSTDYYFFVSEAAVDSDIYTSVELTVDGAKELMCYSDEYSELIRSVKDTINTKVKTQREQARYDDITGEANEELADAREEFEEKFQEADEQLADGKAELEDAREEIANGWKKINDGIAQLDQNEAQLNSQISDGYDQIASGNDQIAAAKEQLDASAAQLAEGKEQLAAGWDELNTQKEEAYAQISDGMAQIEDGITQARQGKEQLDAQLSMLQSLPSEAQTEETLAQVAYLTEESEKLDATLAALDEQLTALQQQKEAADEQFAQAEQTLQEKEQEIADGEAQLAAGYAQLEQKQAELDQGLSQLKEQETAARQQLEDARSELEDGKQELLDAEQELADGEAELKSQEAELEDARSDAQKELDDAQKEIDDIDMAKWYVQDRNSITSFSTIESDSACIETIGKVFPVLFLAVAILISLTTITRMVEEERGMIGIYKALGFSDRAVYGKYLIYTFTACLAGGIIGNICGFVALPRFLFYVFDAMYKIPAYPILFHTSNAIIGVMMFVIGVVGAAFLSCRSELIHLPAVLMRPKAPKAGSRVFLERIPFIWKRMSFLNKVTARNLFRYKKRLLMTIAGIAGCTALVLLGMAIKDSVTDLMPRQYNHIYQYDLMTVALSDDNETLVSDMEQDASVTDFLNLQIDSIQIKNTENGEEETAQLYVVPTGESLSGYILLESLSGEELDLPDTGVFVTQNLSDVMDFDEGDTLELQNLDLDQAQVEVSAIVHNYLGNAVYMSQEYYERLFGPLEANSVLCHLSDTVEDHTAYADKIASSSDVITCVSTQSMREEFSKAFGLINSVVVLVTTLAAALAFVVLFTLSTTNISERERELATIKVLGFFDGEVHLYVNKETMVLTLIGILFGLPLGRFVSGLLTSVLKMPAVYFAVSVHPFSYVFAAGMTFVFALAVNLITNRSLDHINMVDALKSIE